MVKASEGGEMTMEPVFFDSKSLQSKWIPSRDEPHEANASICSDCRKKSLVDGQQIKHIRAVQETEAKKWSGINISYASRPGKIHSTSLDTFHTVGIQNASNNNKKHSKMIDYMKVRIL